VVESSKSAWEVVFIKYLHLEQTATACDAQDECNKDLALSDMPLLHQRPFGTNRTRREISSRVKTVEHHA